MPLYEYLCTACGKLTEKRQKFSDPEITDCPRCCGKLERTITAPAIQFKGGGWYADLYSSGKKPAAPASGSEGSPASEITKSSDTSSSDSSSSKSESGSNSSSEGSSTPATAPASSTPAASSTSSTPAK